MPDPEFNSVEPVRFIPSVSAPPPLIVCDSTFAFVRCGVNGDVFARIGGELSSSVEIQTPDGLLVGAT